MSEQPVAAPSRPKPPGKQYLGLSRNQWFLVGGVFVAAVGYILWRRHQAAKASTAASTTTSTSTSTAAELAALENELAQLQGQGFGGGSSGGGFGGGVAGTGGAPAYSTTTATPAGTPVASNGATSTGTGAAATATKVAGAISNLSASNVGTTTARITWNPASNATGYAYKVTQLNGVTVKSGNTSATSVSLSGLHKGWTYNFGVQGLPGGPGNNIHFTTKG